MPKLTNTHKTLLLLFLLHVLTRVLFMGITGFSNHYDLQIDSYWLVELGYRVLDANFDFTIDRFVASPLYPMVLGIFRWCWGEGAWQVPLTVFQVLLAAYSGLWLYKATLLLLGRRDVALLASIWYAIFPFTLYFTHTFSQESIFQSLWIACIYYLLLSLHHQRLVYVVYAALLFTLAYLTKSHILLFSPFIPIIYLHYYGHSVRSWTYSAVFALIALVGSLPYGLYQHSVGNGYVLSSNGAGCLFYLGNTQAGYRLIADPPKQGTLDYAKMKILLSTAGYFNGSPERYEYILAQPQSIKQQLFVQDAQQWINHHFAQFVVLKLYDLYYFLLPSFNYHYYSFANWLVSLLLCLPLYVFAFRSIWVLLRQKNKAVIPILYIFVTMVLFSTIFYTQNRFRTITLEPFYMVYAAWSLAPLLAKLPIVNTAWAKLHIIFGVK